MDRELTGSEAEAPGARLPPGRAAPGRHGALAARNGGQPRHARATPGLARPEPSVRLPGRAGREDRGPGSLRAAGRGRHLRRRLRRRVRERVPTPQEEGDPRRGVRGHGPRGDGGPPPARPPLPCASEAAGPRRRGVRPPEVVSRCAGDPVRELAARLRRSPSGPRLPAAPARPGRPPRSRGKPRARGGGRPRGPPRAPAGDLVDARGHAGGRLHRGVPHPEPRPPHQRIQRRHPGRGRGLARHPRAAAGPSGPPLRLPRRALRRSGRRRRGRSGVPVRLHDLLTRGPEPPPAHDPAPAVLGGLLPRPPPGVLGGGAELPGQRRVRRCGPLPAGPLLHREAPRMRATDLSVKPTAVLVGGRLAGSAATIALPIVLARVFGPHEFGTYKQLFLIYTTLLVIAPMAMAESLYYFIPRAPRTAGSHVANSLLVLTLTGMAALGLLAAGGRPLAEWFNNPDLVPHIVLLGLFL